MVKVWRNYKVRNLLENAFNRLYDSVTQHRDFITE